ncbi:glycosyltransferase family 2 protein [Spirosoma fluminis]
MNPVVLSIITINLNNKTGLEATIRSVLNQSFKAFEFLIIDGASEDGSVQLIETYSDQVTYWISEEDQGIYHAMNKGIRRAEGTYCLFLNSGDWFIDGSVLETVFSRSQTADLLIGRCRVSKGDEQVYITKLPEALTLKSFIGNTLPHQATFIKTALFAQFGLYDERYHIHSDYAFWIRALIVGNCSTAALDVLVADYNLDGISSSTEQNPDKPNEIPLILSEYFPERVLQDYQNWAVEKQELVYFDWLKSREYLYALLKVLYKVSKNITRATACFRPANDKN